MLAVYILMVRMGGYTDACVDQLQFLACMVITIFQTHALP